ncbi:helix-turn-helix domain-containing protein [Adhaeribacter sp. BT258]|uniref:Helix-turn-helix domain-containing protein n=1 Tax=Adhaeribacter terrigena TaxID=2793070 RepID=A0ABS1BZ31_9BACT|nr:AraC family transcriptional regulator [Adhaeribacter terrigena]MBK0402172.1 helix-turn-helix domain-containing protein [Adhaeribacter terrigena]
MPKEQIPIYQIQDFKAQTQKERYFYASTLAKHLEEHLFAREPHKHAFYIVLLLTQGSGTHTIDFKKYEVRPNTVFFMKPGQVHNWELSDDADGVIIFFTSEFYLQEFPHRKLYDFPFFNALLYQPVLHVSEAGKSLLLQTCKALQAEYAGKALRRNEMLSCQLNVLLIQLTRIYSTRAEIVEMPGGELVLLQALEQLIEQHFKAHLPVTFYSEQLNLTTRHLNEICKRSLGKTTTELLQERLLLEAQRLLVHSELTSSQIATELGYFDTTYFFRFFKKHTGQTPEQFRSEAK